MSTICIYEQEKFSDLVCPKLSEALQKGVFFDTANQIESLKKGAMMSEKLRDMSLLC